MAEVVRACTSPVRSAIRDNVARKLAGPTPFGRLNLAAAAYAVDLAKSLGLLQNKNLVWTNLGQLLNLIYDADPPTSDGALSDRKIYFFLRAFLEFDGAAFIHFAKRIEEEGRIPSGCSGERWPEIAQRLFRETYAEYLTLATDPKDRVRIRQLDERRRAKPFKGNSGRHQCFVHLNALYRLGLIASASSDDRSYTQVPPDRGASSPTAKLLRLLPDAAELERSVSAGRLYHVVGELSGRDLRQHDFHSDAFAEMVRHLYDRIISTGISLCSLQTLTEAIQIESLVLGNRPPHAQEILNQLRSMQRESPRAIRFHVDVYGRPAYLKIS